MWHFRTTIQVFLGILTPCLSNISITVQKPPQPLLEVLLELLRGIKSKEEMVEAMWKPWVAIIRYSDLRQSGSTCGKDEESLTL